MERRSTDGRRHPHRHAAVGERLGVELPVSLERRLEAGIAPTATPAVNSPMLFQSGTVLLGIPSGLGCGINPGGGALGREDVALSGLGDSNMKA